MSQKKKVILLYGGKSGEHEVALVSAAGVYQHLDRDLYEVIPVAMDKEGRCHLFKDNDLTAYTKALPVDNPNAKSLPSLIEDGRLAIDADVVFPVAHGALYEDGCLQGLLKLADVAVVGCDVLSSALGMDKLLARRVGCEHDIPYTKTREISWHSSLEARSKFAKAVAEELGFPLFVKPCNQGSSVGISKVHDEQALLLAIADALRFDETALVEAFVKGREIELAVLENKHPDDEPRVSVAGEIVVHHEDGFYSYSAKYLESTKTDLIIPAPLTEEMQQRLVHAAATIFKRLKCKGMARVDFFVSHDGREFWFNEINTIPGFTPISMYPKLWASSGLAYADLLNELIDLALIHQSCRKQLLTSYV